MLNNDYFYSVGLTFVEAGETHGQKPFVFILFFFFPQTERKSNNLKLAELVYAGRLIQPWWSYQNTRIYSPNLDRTAGTIAVPARAILQAAH